MDERRVVQLQEVICTLPDADFALLADVASLLADPETATDAEAAEGAVTSLRVGAALEGTGARWLHRLESSVVWAADGARSPAAWLDTHAQASKARAGFLLARARKLASLPILERAFARGAIGDEKVKLLLATAKLVPAEVHEHQQYLLDTVITLTVEATHVFLATWYEKVRPPVPDSDEADGSPPEPAAGRTHVQFSKTTGGHHVNGFLGTETSATIIGAADAEIDAWFRAGLLDGDTRTRPELYAAALEAIAARHGLTGDQHGQARPLALVLADADTLAGRIPTAESPNMDPVCEIVGHGPISPETARRLLCGADTSRVILRGGSEVLDVGMRQRFATSAQWRGLMAAAGGRCEFTGCDAPHDWCQAHHLDPFNPRADTGPTDMANLALLCHRHHQAVHEGHFTMTRGPTGITVRRPDGTILTVPLHHRPRPHPPDPDP